jgi:hypothetical protein
MANFASKYLLAKRNPETGKCDILLEQYGVHQWTKEQVAQVKRDQYFEIYSPEYWSSSHYDDYGRRRNLDHLKIVADMTSGEYELVRFRDPEWRAREIARLSNGTYDPLGWSLDPIEDHFAHYSVEQGQSMIAYTPDARKGETDIQVVTKPGRYLTKFYPHLSGDEVRWLACTLDKALEVRFAHSGEDIVTVYVNGPNSCMSHDLDEYSSHIHPVAVYGDGPDLQLAYLASSDLGNDNFRCSARALVWPAKKVYGRVYGDEHRLVPALAALGYKYGTLNGAHLQMIENDGRNGGYVMPYIDGCQRVTNKGDHFTIGGSLDASSTDGVIQSGRYCPGLDRNVDDDVEFHYVRDLDDEYSETYTDDNCFMCEGSGNYYSNNTTSVCLEDTDETVSFQWARRHCYYHEASEGWCRHESNLPVDEDEAQEDDTPPAAPATKKAFVAVPYSSATRFNGEWLPASECELQVGSLVRYTQAPLRLGILTIAEIDGDGDVHFAEGADNAWVSPDRLQAWALPRAIACQSQLLMALA